MDKQLKIAFTGPESSGKTTMAELIAEVYSTSFIPEYAREFLKDKTIERGVIASDIVFLKLK